MDRPKINNCLAWRICKNSIHHIAFRAPAVIWASKSPVPSIAYSCATLWSTAMPAVWHWAITTMAVVVAPIGIQCIVAFKRWNDNPSIVNATSIPCHVSRSKFPIKKTMTLSLSIKSVVTRRTFFFFCIFGLIFFIPFYLRQTLYI